jgi:ribosomal protein S18 acetylase RimI-like enzyme
MSRLAVTVREATPDDAPAIAEVQAAAGRPPMSAENHAAIVGDPNRIIVVATSDGVIAGWAQTHCWTSGDPPAPAGHYLGGVTVDPTFRRRGVASALTSARLEWIWMRASHAWYVVNSANRASVELHRRYGFVEVARAARFHTVAFTGGDGILLRSPNPTGPSRDVLRA